MHEFERPSPDSIRIERLLDAPVETVWRWLTDPELRARWFAGGTAADAEGAEFELVFDHDNLSDSHVPYPADYAQWQGAKSLERLVEMDRPGRLAFTWDGGKEGIVTFELSAEGERTRLVLTHRAISGPAPAADFAGGWLSHLAVLEARLAGRPVQNFWALHDRIKTEVERSFG